MSAIASIRGSLGLVAFLALASACATERPLLFSSMKATMWVQTSAEYRALTEQAYRAAETSLSEALADSSWTASLEQEGSFGHLPPAVIMDVDETALDSTEFQRQAIESGGFDPQAWEEWVASANAPAMPAALEFARRAHELGITLFFVTNRDRDQEEASRRNLAAVGFPLESDRDTVLMRNEREEWGKDKASRRRAIAAEYRILLLIGDDLNDFAEAPADRAHRLELATRFDPYWGRRWIILPNPIYGSWERAK